MRPNVPPLIDYPSSICAEAGQIKDADRLAQMTDTDNSLCIAFTGFSYDIVCLPIMPVMEASTDARKPLELKIFFCQHVAKSALVVGITDEGRARRVRHRIFLLSHAIHSSDQHWP